MIGMEIIRILVYLASVSALLWGIIHIVGPA